MPGELLAQGRAADVFAAGPGRVLRRYREGERDDTALEATAMEHARRHGFPVPIVYEADGRDLVLERLDGPTMLGDIVLHPWRVGRHGRTLAALHRQLHEIRAPAGLPCHLGRGEQLVHFDLHPDNVLITPRGPFVIDWSNASRGDGADDVALSWVIMATSTVPGPWPVRVLGSAGRGLLVNAFLAGVDREAAQARVAEVAQRRLELDPHLLDRERHALEKLIHSPPWR